MNRNRPLKQARIVATCVFLSFLYMYCLFTPHQSQPYVLEFQTQESIKYYKHVQEQSLLLQKRRYELAKQRQEARVRRNQARTINATKIQHQNSTDSNIITDSVSEQQHALYRVLGIILSLLASACMCATAQFLFGIFNGTSTTTPTAAARTQTRQQQREEQFRTWARRLNRQRVQQGERPLSLASLRLVMRGRDITGNDYEALLRMEEEAGPAMHALLQSMGATLEEINRCPVRTLAEHDDLLQHSPEKEPPHCAVCLETYELGNQVRTIPCFHTFHTDCIDPWLTQKAVCPVCKHPAVG